MAIDALIFDMDGTLWDAVDSYAHVWNETFDTLGSQRRITRSELVDCMGMTLPDILHRLVPAQQVDLSRFLELLAVNEAVMMPRLGGSLYPGVEDGIKRLSKDYQLFMISNCSASGLVNFLSFTGLTPYITATLSNGETHQDKSHNISEIIRRYNLQSPVYVGDTQGDSNQCRHIGVPFIHVTYGFGTCNDAMMQVDSFTELVDRLTYNQI